MPRVRTRSVEWLLALLMLRHGRTVNRSWLAGTLWPDSEESQALHNLRDILVHLRKALGSERERLQSPTRDTLTFDLEGAEVDILQFDAAMKVGNEDCLQRAITFYTGSLLEGCYEEWVFSERASREQACLLALETLANAAEQRRDFAEVLVLLRRAQGMDGLRDTTQRGLMRVLAACGDTPAALSSYRDYRLRLREQMNLDPDQETVALFQQIREQAKQTAPQRNASLPQARPKLTSSVVSESLPSALPHPLTALIGRDKETHTIAQTLSQSRLVTLVGGGGVGKTRLAIEVARKHTAHLAQEVAFIELASLSEPTLLPTFVANALGIREEATPEPAFLLQALTGWLSTHNVLLVLDNCEHLIEAAASLTQTLLERCPDLHILTTSRQRLGLTGEITWRVPSLPVPKPEQLPADPTDARAAALTFPAIQLFIERASSAHREFHLTRREDVEAVCRICQRLDGIPLAIELAAARVRSLSVENIHSKLDQRFRLLRDGSRTALPRQQTLRSLIDWSYDLLSEDEKALLSRLSVFSGGWTLEEAETVCAGDPVEDWETLDLLTSLVDKSLVVAEASGASVRYHLLETVRQYAQERLQESGAESISRERHLAFFLTLAEDAEAEMSRAGQMELISCLEEEHDNLRAALDWSLKSKEEFDLLSPSAALRLCGALRSFWRIRGHLSEGREWCLRVLGTSDAQARTLERAQVLNTAGILANIQGDHVSALTYYEESLSIFREREDKRGIASSLHYLGSVSFNRSDYDKARAYLVESLAMQREIGDRSGIGAALHNLGNVARNLGDYASAGAYYEESLSLFREIGHRPFLANALNNLGSVALNLGDNDRAQTFYEECLSIQREIGNQGGIANALIGLGNLAHTQCDYVRAQTYFNECLSISREIGAKSNIGSALHNLGEGAYHQGDPLRAQAYFEESLTLFREIGYRLCIANSLNCLGNIAADQTNYARAQTYYAECLSIRREIGDRHGLVTSLEAFGHLAAKISRLQQATVLWGVAQRLREEIGAPIPLSEQEKYDCEVTNTRQVLGEEAFTVAWAAGRAMTLEQAIEIAMNAEAAFM